jgi:hypothetical protein
MSMTIDRDRLPPQWKVAGSSLRHGATLTAADGRIRYWTGTGQDRTALHFTAYRIEESQVTPTVTAEPPSPTVSDMSLI